MQSWIRKLLGRPKPPAQTRVNTNNACDLMLALRGWTEGGTVPASTIQIKALSRLVVDLLVEVEALRDALVRSSHSGADSKVHRGYDIPCHDKTLVEDKEAYAAAYVNAAYILHNGAGPSNGVEKLLARFYPKTETEPREALMLRRLGFSEAEVERFLKAAAEAEMFS